MFKKLRLPALVLGTALALLSPGAAVAKDHGPREHKRHRFSISIGAGPRYYYGPGYYERGYYDRWGYWHPYGFYDRWGHWHRY